MKQRLRTLRVDDVRYRWSAQLRYHRDADLNLQRFVRVRVWGGGKNSQVLSADLVSTSEPGPWGSGVTDVAYPTPKDVRAIIDYALEQGWDPAAVGGRFQLRPAADQEVAGFRVTDSVGRRT
ncbi:MAG TPA: hypothetical protein VN767_13540 [Streptosporangiaceae bacterium]|nr:hypothetical protein [Streptosporangiaceae bacterium]